MFLGTVIVHNNNKRIMEEQQLQQQQPQASPRDPSPPSNNDTAEVVEPVAAAAPALVASNSAADVNEPEPDNPSDATVPSSCSINSLLNNATEMQEIDDEFNALPDQSLILERLAQIREYKRQVLVMMDKIKNASPEIDREMLRKLVTAYDNFKDQEEQYLTVLQKILAFKHNFAIAAMEETRLVQSSRAEQKNDQKNLPASEDINGNSIKDSADRKISMPQNNMTNQPDQLLLDDEEFCPENIQRQAPPSSAADIDSGVESLIEQRNVLQKMMRQQEDLRALHGKMEAQLKQRENEGSQAPPPFSDSQKDYLAAKQIVEVQAASLAAKRKELEQLKEKLSVVATLTSQPDLEDDAAQLSGEQQQRRLEDHVGVLKDRKRLMQQILGHLDEFEGQNEENQQFSNALIEPDGPAAASHPMSNVETTLQQKYNDLLATKKRIADIQQMMAALNASNNNNIPMKTQFPPLEPNHPSLLVKANNVIDESLQSNKPDQTGFDFDAQRERANLQNIRRHLMTLGEDELMHMMSSSLRPDRKHVTSTSEFLLDGPPQGHTEVSGMNSDDFLIDFYTQALQKKQQPKNSTSTSSGQQKQLNNLRDNAPADFATCSRVANAFCSDSNGPFSSISATGLDNVIDNHQRDDILDVYNDISPVVDHHAHRGIDNQQHAHQHQHQPLPHRQNNESSACALSNVTDIAKNPRLASFRRNNDFAIPAATTTTTTNHNQRRMVDSGPQPRRSNIANANNNATAATMMMTQSMTSSMDSQYDQLTGHIESIRSIFDSFMREQQQQSNQQQQRSQSATGTESQGQQQPYQSLTSPMNPSYSFVSTPMLAANGQQQQQLLMTLLTCQQQLQLQQYELRYLHQMYQDLAGFYHQQRNSEQQQQQQQKFQQQLQTPPSGFSMQLPPQQVQHIQQQQNQQQFQQSQQHQIGPHQLQQHSFTPLSDTFPQQPPHSSRSQISMPAEQALNSVSLLDGRPLSSASLYNLLAPNPYLTAPYYPPRQINTARGNVQLPKNFISLNNNAATVPLPLNMNMMNTNMNNPVNENAAYMSRSVVDGLPTNFSAATLPKYRNPTNNVMDMSCISERGGLEMMVNKDSQQQRAVIDGEKLRNSRTVSLGDCSSVVSRKMSIAPDRRSPLGYNIVSGGRSISGHSISGHSMATNGQQKTKNFDRSQNNAAAASYGGTPQNDVTPENGRAASIIAVDNANDPILSDPFESLREMIYSEVATLISQNERRPHYLLELFRELQLLSSDHLRMRAFQAIRDVLNRYLVEDSESNGGGGFLRNIRRIIEETQNESNWTSDTEDAFNQKRRISSARNTATAGAGGFSETAGSGSTVSSTPEHRSGGGGGFYKREHFSTSTSRKNSHFMKTANQTAAMRSVESSADSKDYKNRQKLIINNNNSNNAIPPVSKKKSCPAYFMIGDSVLRATNVQHHGESMESQVKKVAQELTAFVRDSAQNGDDVINGQLVQYLRKFVLTLVVTKCTLPTKDENPFFQRRLCSSLDNVLEKYRGQKLFECSDQFLSEVSHMILNELSFHRLMESIDDTMGNSVNVTPRAPLSSRETAKNATTGQQLSNRKEQLTTSIRHNNSGIVLRSPSEFSERLPFDEFRRVDNALAYIDDDFRDVENEIFAVSAENPVMPNVNRSNQSTPTTNADISPLVGDFRDMD